MNKEAHYNNMWGLYTDVDMNRFIERTFSVLELNYITRMLQGLFENWGACFGVSINVINDGSSRLISVRRGDLTLTIAFWFEDEPILVELRNSRFLTTLKSYRVDWELSVYEFNNMVNREAQELLNDMRSILPVPVESNSQLLRMLENGYPHWITPPNTVTKQDLDYHLRDDGN